MGILSWIIFGLIAGVVAKWAHPGKENMGWIATILLGVAGAFVGGFISNLCGLGHFGGWSLWSFLIAVGGGVLLLFIYGFITGK